MQITAQDWLVLELSHNSPTALGFVTALQFLPVLLFSLLGGKLADRFDKRRLLIIANSAYLVLAGIMGVLIVTNVVQLWCVFIFAALYGVVNSLETPTRQAFVSEMVGRELLPNALAMSAATFNSARIIGPAIGGLMIHAVGTGPAFIINSITFIGPIIAVARMAPSQLFRERIAGGVAASEARIIDGLRYVRARADLMMPMVLMLVVGLVAFNFQVTLPLLAKTVFHAQAGSFGLLTTALATGALGGAFAGSARKGRPSPWLVLGTATVFTALEIVVGFAPSFLVAAILLIPTGFFMIFFAQAANQRVQMGVSAAFRGRVMALYVLVFLGTTPIGAPLIGWCSASFGARSGIWLGGSVGVAMSVAVLAYELRRTGGRLLIGRNPLRIHVTTPETYRAEGLSAESLTAEARDVRPMAADQQNVDSRTVDAEHAAADLDEIEEEKDAVLQR